MKRLSKMINPRSSITKTRVAAAEQAEADKITTQKVKFASLHEDEDGDDVAAHRLRQNPIKALRVSISKNVVNNQQRFVCNKCGKAFQSSKAMCGHMASHSVKEKPLSNVVAKKKLAMMNSDSDTESEAGGGGGPMRRRSRRARYKKHAHVTDSKLKLDVVNKCSSEASGVEQEEEEVAICLMMLSRDSSNWGGLNSICDSSDNNSVVLEDRSISTRLRNKDSVSTEYALNEIKEKHERKKVESLGDFDEGYFRNGEENVGTVIRIRNQRKNKFEEDSNFEPHLSLKKLKSLMESEGYSQIQRPKMELYPRKDHLSESYNAEIRMSAKHTTVINSQLHQPFDVNVAYNKQFTDESIKESGCNSIYRKMGKGKGILNVSSGNVGDDLKKDMYDSPKCFKNFGSGHELGHLWRVHLAEGPNEIKCDEVAANFRQYGTQSHDSIDLNLPAPMDDEEANESMGSY